MFRPRTFWLNPWAAIRPPCIGLAGVFLEHIDPEAIMVVLPSDHLIDNTGRFRQLLGVAAEYAEKNRQTWSTMGIKTDLSGKPGMGIFRWVMC
jgi:mannose-1-phosphate guanylyltransferase